MPEDKKQVVEVVTVEVTFIHIYDFPSPAPSYDDYRKSVINEIKKNHYYSIKNPRVVSHIVE